MPHKFTYSKSGDLIVLHFFAESFVSLQMFSPSLLSEFATIPYSLLADTLTLALMVCLFQTPTPSNQQLPVWFQLAIFLNGVGHYGNAATTQDIAEWAGVAVGTVYNCYQCVMLSLLHWHDAVIHFNPIGNTPDYAGARRVM